MWLADHGWWVAVVEFQPSGWSKGSYLNVGAMWLWFEKDYFSFDYGSRVEDFAPYEDEAQFAPLAGDLADRAAGEVARLRSHFPSVTATAQQLAAKSPMGFWDRFNAGVACALAGDTAAARRFLGEVAGTDDRRDWAQAAASLAREYSLAVADVAGFRRRIEVVVHRARELLRLPGVTNLALD
ncbi:MAG: hypothetical protein J0H19_15045 [Rhodospirillales bacterium]|nr:hypothetical protein [Rhodospirillales bacterium]